MTTEDAVAAEVVRIPVAELVMKYDVRKELNEDRVQLFIDLYTAGADVKPIKVVQGTHIIHEGRHRVEALRRMERKHAWCTFVEHKSSMNSLWTRMPPICRIVHFHRHETTRLYVMKQLIESDTSRSDIVRSFERFYPPSLVNKLLRDATALVHKSRMHKAINAVAFGNVTMRMQRATTMSISISCAANSRERVENKSQIRQQSPISSPQSVVGTKVIRKRLLKFSAICLIGVWTASYHTKKCSMFWCTYSISITSRRSVSSTGLNG